ncbi:hypothetical protein HRI_003838100 [Hibiscus trionum]|uniref:Sulfotransferase n=1 Tax=Hibiscus trionum TaxID=183268 RepID=A0A9W7MH54_HIBTR|nr:hypothetical protein HRI_003838100 [Hibiscus trionum]
MDAAETSKAKIASLIQDVEKSCDDELQQLLHTLPKEEGWISGSLYLYQGFWCSPFVLKPMISFQTHFQAFDSDVIVATFPKCGTTWLKALTFSTLYRSQFSRGGIEHPLLNSTLHQLVHFLGGGIISLIATTCNERCKMRLIHNDKQKGIISRFRWLDEF